MPCILELSWLHGSVPQLRSGRRSSAVATCQSRLLALLHLLLLQAGGYACA